MGELASTLGVVPRSATGLVDALEEAGMVARTIDPANRRSVLVTTTQAGRDVQIAMARARAQAGDGLFGALDTRERRALADLLGNSPRGRTRPTLTNRFAGFAPKTCRLAGESGESISLGSVPVQELACLRAMRTCSAAGEATNPTVS